MVYNQSEDRYVLIDFGSSNFAPVALNDDRRRCRMGIPPEADKADSLSCAADVYALGTLVGPMLLNLVQLDAMW